MFRISGWHIDACITIYYNNYTLFIDLLLNIYLLNVLITTIVIIQTVIIIIIIIIIIYGNAFYWYLL